MSSLEQADRILRVGIVGCGRVAYHHARFITEVHQARLVAVADTNLHTANKFAQQFGVGAVYASLDDLLESSELDVLHVVTPPAYHYASAQAALERGIHVLLEKPLAFSSAEVNRLYQLAERNGVLICPDFIHLFHPKVREMGELTDSGQLGRVVHVDTRLCLNLEEETADAREAESLHWSFGVPGGLLRDYTSHVLYLTLRFLGAVQDFKVNRQSLGGLPQGMIDHLSVQIAGQRGTGSALLTCRPGPSSFELRVFCERGTAEVDLQSQTISVSRQTAIPRRIAMVAKPFQQAWGISTQTLRNIYRYLRGTILPYMGLRALIPAFYDNIRNSGQAPISQALASAVTELEESIFAGCPSPLRSGCYSPSTYVSRQRPRILVTGASGYIGREVVKRLVEQGYDVRAMVRASSNIELLQPLGAEIFLGDVRRLEDVHAAAAGMNTVVHLAAGMSGSTEFIVDSCVRGTQNVATAAAEQRLRRVIYISSFSVYDYTRLKNGECITENSLLEERPELRGGYSLGKRRAEEIALSHLPDSAPAWTILRPSLVVGNGRHVLSPLGPKFGNVVVCMGRARHNLLLIHVEDLASAILHAMESDNTRGRVFTVTNSPIKTRDYVKECVRCGEYKRVRVVYVPYLVVRTGALIAAILKKGLGRGPALNRRRLLSVYRNADAGPALLTQETGWQPTENLLQRLREEAQQAAQSSVPTSALALAPEEDHTASVGNPL